MSPAAAAETHRLLFPELMSAHSKNPQKLGLVAFLPAKCSSLSGRKKLEESDCDVKFERREKWSAVFFLEMSWLWEMIAQFWFLDGTESQEKPQTHYHITYIYHPLRSKCIFLWKEKCGKCKCELSGRTRSSQIRASVIMTTDQCLISNPHELNDMTFLMVMCFTGPLCLTYASEILLL